MEEILYYKKNKLPAKLSEISLGALQANEGTH